MAAVTICSDFGAQKNSQLLCPLFPHLFAMKWWDWMPWSWFSECWALSQIFHSPLSPSLLEKCKSKLQGITSHLLERPSLRNLQTMNTGEDVEKRKHSCTVGENVNWYNHYGEQYGDSLKKKKTRNRTTMHVCACMLSSFRRVWLFATLQTIALQAPLFMGFSREEYCSGLPCPPPGDLSDSGIKFASLMSPALASRFFTSSATWEVKITIWPNNPTPGHIHWENHNWKRHMCPKVLHNTFYKS